MASGSRKAAYIATLSPALNVFIGKSGYSSGIFLVGKP